MRLRKPCQHGRYDSHYIDDPDDKYAGAMCAGGEFLPEDALVIEKVDGEWPDWAIEVLYNVRVFFPNAPTALLDALADQVGEPG